MKLAKNTGGYFDPTIGKRLTELGYGMERKQWKQRSLKNHGDYKDIEISGDMIVLHGDIDLEFGGIGKWYMLGWISEFLQKYERFLIDFGWDLSGKWSWKVWLENPFALDEAIGVMILDDEFLACSSGAKRKWWEHHHLINPHTGESASEVMASFVESKDSMTADGYATTLCVMPWNLACETLEKTPEIEGVLISKEGKIFQSKGSKSELFS